MADPIESSVKWLTTSLFDGNVPEGFGDPDASGREMVLSYKSLFSTTWAAFSNVVYEWLYGRSILRTANLVLLYAAQVYDAQDLQKVRTADSIALLCLALPLSIILVIVLVTPSSWPLGYHYAVVHYGLRAAIAWVNYIQCDLKFEESRNAWITAREGFLQYTAMVIALRHWNEWWTLSLWILTWPIAISTFSSVCTVLSALAAQHAPHWLRVLLQAHATFQTAVIFIVLTMQTYLMELHDLAEIIAIELLPKTWQRLLMSLQSWRTHVTTVEDFKYPLLQPHQKRLLVIIPGGLLASGTIKTILQSVHVNDRFLLYDAVSYHWGSNEKNRQILVGGRRMLVTTSAFETLLACRSATTWRVIWIDAICINQDDEQEKETQIQYMPLIYRNAQAVRCFPGHGPFDRSAGLLIHSKANAPGFSDVNKTPSYLRLYLGLIDRRWKALARVCQSPYWVRGWVAQEIALASKKYIYMGGIWIDMSQFVAFVGEQLKKDDVNTWLLARTASKMTHRDIYPQDSIRTFSLLYWHNGFAAKPEDNLTLEQILLFTWQLRTGDARDKLYAMIGISAAEGLFNSADKHYFSTKALELEYWRGLPKEMSVTYSISSAELFRKLSLSFFTGEHKSIHLLALAGTGFGRTGDMPSWVPDLGEIRVCRPLTGLMAADQPWCSAGSQEVAIVQHSGAKLTLAGILCGRLTHLNSRGPLLMEHDHFSAAELAKRKHDFGRGVLELCESIPEFWPEEPGWREIYAMWTLIGGEGDAHSASKDFQRDMPFADVLQLWISIQGRLSTGKDLRYWMVNPDNIDDILDLKLLRKGMYFTIDRGIHEFSYGRNFGVTSEWKACMVPPLSQIGDQIFIPFGAQTPYVIRKTEASQNYELVGEASVQGLMDGEVFTREYEVIEIVLE